MGNYLICSAPARSHVAPMITIAAHLHRQGHRVRMLTGRLYEKQVVAAGVEYVPLPAECDFDDSDLDAAFPGRSAKKGLARFRFDIDRVFIDAISPEHRALQDLIAAERPDAIMVDIGFTGVMPMLVGPRNGRPPIFTGGIAPLQFGSRDTAPFGLAKPPSTTTIGRAKNAALRKFSHFLFRENHRHANEVLRREGVGELPMFLMDSAVLTDRYLQFCCPSFEYPRSDMPSNVAFVGPMLTPGPATFTPPDWWDELDGTRPVVHVTQGTIDNSDLGRLVGPTIQGLADADVLVVATTCGRPASAIPGTIPANTRIADFIPHAELLPRIQVMITNGGYGGVQQALANGVPLIVAGDTEDKPEVAARVAWSGTGIDLRSGQPTPQAIRRAVDTILSNTSYRDKAKQMAEEIAGTSALDAVTAELEVATDQARTTERRTGG